MPKNNIVWIIGAVVVVSLFMGWISIPEFGGDGDDVDNLYPSTLKTSITLNTGDKLATSATNANVSYYVFDSAGNYLKEGTTSAGTASFNVPTAVSNYKILVYDDSSAVAELDYLPFEITFSTDGADPGKRAEQTVNIDLYRESGLQINAVRDPVDLNSNLTGTTGATEAFDVLISANTTNAASYYPVLLFSSNITEVERIEMAGLEEVPCPDKNAAVTGFQHTCFETGEEYLESREGIKMYSGNVVFDASTAIPDASTIEITALDTSIYVEADYKTAGYSAFKYGLENPITNADIGASDSSSKYLDFSG